MDTHQQLRQALARRLFEEFLSDVRYAWRQMQRSPAFSAVAIVTLALGIGANTASFSLVNAVMLKMLPVREPQQLRMIEWWSKGQGGWTENYSGGSTSTPEAGGRSGSSFSYPGYLRMRNQATAFEEIFASASGSWRVGLTVDGGIAELARAVMVTGNYFRGLGTSAAVGRTLLPDDDDERTRQPVFVLSHGYWKRRFGSDPAIVGKAVRLNGTAGTIVGVSAAGFQGLDPGQEPDLYVPLWMQPGVQVTQPRLQERRTWWVRMIGRLKRDAGDLQAQQELTPILQQEVRESAPPDRKYDPPEVRLVGGAQGLDHLRRSLARPLSILMGVAGVVLLIACSNLAGLMLARATSRTGEMGTRLALGAARARLIRQLLTESLMLSLLGGAAGVGLAVALRGTLPTLMIRWSETPALNLEVDWRMLGFCVGVCVLTGLVTGILPALRATRVDLVPMLKQGGRQGDGNPRLRTGKMLVGVQVALSAVLLVGAGLFVRTVVNLQSQAFGIETGHVLTFQVNPALNGYKTEQTKDFIEQLVGRLKGSPGVVSASVSQCGVLAGCSSSTTVRARGVDGKEGPEIELYVHSVAPGYFQTMGIPLLMGRDLNWSDREGAARVLVINRSAARKAFGDRHPLGEQIGDRTVVGVVADARYNELRGGAPPTMYQAYRQNRIFAAGTLLVRTSGDPSRLGTLARHTVRSMDVNIPVSEMRTQTELLDRAMAQERVFTSLLAGFGGLAMLLAGIGIYGTLAYAVARRRGEIGIRMALGAGKGNVQRLVLGESLVAVLAGLAVGLYAAASLSQVVESMLFGVKPHDVAVYTGAAIVLLATAAAAAWVPAWRASRVDPMSALRYE